MLKSRRIFLSFIFITSQFFALQTAYSASLPDFVELVEKAQPSVVSIATTIKVPRRNLFSRSSGSSQGPSGSGFLISKDGYVVTNNHVIDGVEKVFVRIHNGHE
jgi:serine protease Do